MTRGRETIATLADRVEREMSYPGAKLRASDSTPAPQLLPSAFHRAVRDADKTALAVNSKSPDKASAASTNIMRLMKIILGVKFNAANEIVRSVASGASAMFGKG